MHLSRITVNYNGALWQLQKQCSPLPSSFTAPKPFPAPDIIILLLQHKHCHLLHIPLFMRLHCWLTEIIALGCVIGVKMQVYEWNMWRVTTDQLKALSVSKTDGFSLLKWLWQRETTEAYGKALFINVFLNLWGFSKMLNCSIKKESHFYISKETRSIK